MVEPLPGWVSDELRAEFPQLRPWTVTVSATLRSSPPFLVERLRHLSDRIRPADLVRKRADPILMGYRVMFRQVGLDPDTTRTPAEEVALEQVLSGKLVSRNLLEDAVLVTLVQTGVPVWPLDARSLDGALGLRLQRPGERLGSEQAMPEPGRIVVADRRGPVAELFGPVPPAHAVRRRTGRITLLAVQVDQVDDALLEHSLWSCAELLVEGDTAHAWS